MKNIHDILATYEINLPEDKKEAFDKAVLENYKTIADYEKQGERLKTAEGKVVTTEEALKAFADVDVDALRVEITKLQGDLSQKDTEYQAKISDMAFDSAISAAVGGMKGKSAKAITAMLDLDALKGSNNQETDIKAALEALKESDAYLFDTEQVPPHYAGGTGNSKLTGVTKEDYAKMGYAERLLLKQDRPETYEKMKGM
jgi:Phage minor structural protein GP20.